MKRMKVLIGKRRVMVIATLAILVLAAAALVASSASFTAQAANTDNVFTTGSLHLSDNQPATAWLSAALMVPGDKKSGTVTITNTGDVAGKFSLVVAKKADVGGFGQKLLLTITDGTTTWQKTVDNMLGTINLGTINPGAANAKVYTITAEFPDTGVNASGVGNENGYMGAAVTVDFTWNAITP